MADPALAPEAGTDVQETLEAILLGLVEGITEFLPVSSTGHLLIAQHWLGPRSELFNVVIQVGAILGVVLVYRQRLLDLSLRFRRPENRDYVYKLAGAFAITAVGGFAAKLAGAELPETIAPVAWALIVGGVAIIVIERVLANAVPVEQVTWRVAAWVGASQVVAAVFPGTSRSAAAIFAAMLAGLTSRPAAAEFAFLVGIPTMMAAAAYELLKLLGDEGAGGEDWTALAIAFAAAAVVAFASVKWLLIYIRAHRFTPFAWYRIAFGALLLAVVRGAPRAEAQSRGASSASTLGRGSLGFARRATRTGAGATNLARALAVSSGSTGCSADSLTITAAGPQPRARSAAAAFSVWLSVPR
jgi:undecaprenyl-diphosphatase